MILVPVAVLQIIVGTLVYQRYFNQVTDQLTSVAISNIKYAVSESRNDQEFSGKLKKLGIKNSNLPVLTENRFGFFDISGRMIRDNFEESFGETVYVDSQQWGTVHLSASNHKPALNIEIARARLAPINPHQIMINTLALSMLLVVLSVIFLRNQVRSLRKLSIAAKAFGRGEAIDYRPTGGDEIRSAGRSFLAMRNRITRQREQRNLMLSGVSHDLRTPLTRMKLSVEMLEGDEDRLSLLEDIKAIEELADSFLSYAENDGTEDVQSVELVEYISQICSHYRMATIHAPSKIFLRIKALLFKRAIENILGNAQRYAANIDVNVYKNKRMIIISIDDDGPGIAPMKREEAIKAFARLDNARSQDKGSHAGLGLAIAADAIRQHGGAMRLEESPKKGLRVHIEIPLMIEKY